MARSTLQGLRGNRHETRLYMRKSRIRNKVGAQVMDMGVSGSECRKDISDVSSGQRSVLYLLRGSWNAFVDGI